MPKKLIDRAFLEEYFRENLDNPFAVYFILNLLANGVIVKRENVLTQFPPLRQKPAKEFCLRKFEGLKSKLLPGDLIFTFNRESKISKIIRELERFQWSHVAHMYTDNIVQDMTTNGIMNYNISLLDPVKYDIAVYRSNDFLHKNDYSDWYLTCEKNLENNPKYNWTGVLKAYLFRKFPKFRFIKNRTGPKDTTGSDLINSNYFILIDFV